MSYSPPTYPPQQQSAPVAKSSGIQLTHDADVLIQTYIPPSRDSETPPYRPDDVPKLLPLCIPRVSVNADPASAFARGYNSALETVGITPEIFLSFIDGLNLAIVASPPLRIVNVAGQVIGFVPNHWAMIASIAITTGAQVGLRVLSKTLTDRYLRAANRNLFQPRGLSVRLCTTPAMLRLVAPPGSQTQTDDDPSKNKETLNKIGRGIGTIFLKLPIPIVAPIAARIIHAVADKPPPISPSGYPGYPTDSPILMRRLALLEHTFPGATLPVQTQGLPPPAKPKGAMEIVNSWGIRFDQMRNNKAERKNEERRRAWAQIQAAGVAQGEYPYGMRSGRRAVRSRSPSPMPIGNDGRYMDHRTARRAAREERKAHQKERKAYQEERKAYREERKAYRKMQKGQRKGLLSGMSREERRAANADLLEHWTTDKLLWVVVMPAEKDEAIADIQIAEDPANEERIDEETWKMVMKLEKDQLEDDVESEEEWEEELATEDEDQHPSTSKLHPPNYV